MALDTLIPNALIPDARAEAEYAAHAPSDHRKAWGQFFTPPRLAALMADWVAGARPGLILDPAMGAGVLTRAALARCPDARVVAYERDRAILSAADAGGAEVRHQDFLRAGWEEYDGAVMNPPYIRHRALRDHGDMRAAIGARAGYAIPKSANLYVDFVVKAACQLRRGGRGAFLIPGEWMGANFARGFKQFLLGPGGLQQVVLFSQRHVFPDALTTASILLVERP
ncbi:Eco57I restriction-modification methylase domain-containing protein [Novosphingobium sp. KACC 22771]|uniref:Eco57I restriction-modification methylase domain-containing protein n=1 Tax=Novosphingobium sp. KACC 22771 TaxID=3025670 RepID=UPI002365D337|nr:N-6 DNA methylase [Novosphingobium sp. KACC 22771]WDF72179.1 Eco57I restriction-modification methylase domain-containing protein [Novosphingobium sp. KACC 22771]